jgi:hypothetical protein
LSDSFGGGHSDMFQAAVYSLTRVDAAYERAWHQSGVSSRFETPP